MKFVKITPDDNVGVALTELKCGEEALGVTLIEDIPAGHKFAIRPITEGENIIKYSAPIGRATADVAVGAWVHTHNTKTNLDGILEYSYNPVEIPEKAGKTVNFKGFKRKDGKVGIRNEIWVIPTVGCVNSPAEVMVKEVESKICGSVDGVFALTHPFGCSQLGGDHLNTQKALAGLAHHPNAGGVLVLGLGCENNNLDEFKKVLGEVDPERVRFLNCQDCEDEVEEGKRIIEELQEICSRDKRVPVPMNKLVIGLKCGGSDGYSGITANPLAGRICDRHTEFGGAAVLTEVPEMFGAEQILMERCESREIFEKTVSLINDAKNYYISHGQPVSENPSPGNRAGGITTLEEKSLGCVQKGGQAVVTDVLDYGDTVKK
ncbi:MAG: altronate dehydratase, partial [Clostridia bacterium]|nr:altronate dehydratase [Clostridia bacterium]